MFNEKENLFALVDIRRIHILNDIPLTAAYMSETETLVVTHCCGVVDPSWSSTLTE